VKPNEVVNDLLHMHALKSRVRAVGICHTFKYTKVIKELIVANGGAHYVMFRNIFQRINSWVFYQRKSFGVKSDDAISISISIYKELSKITTEKLRFDTVSDRLVDGGFIENIFNLAIHTFIHFDIENNEYCLHDELLIF